MRNRALQLRFVKTNQSDAAVSDETDSTFEGKVAIIGHFVEKGFKNIGMAVCAYVVADTLRQVIVAKANH